MVLFFTIPYNVLMQKKPKRTLTILQVLPSLICGGTERGVIDIATAITKAGHKSLVASSGGPMVGSLTRSKTQHFTLPLASKNPVRMLLNAFALSYIIKRYNVDIVQAESRAPAWSAYLATRLTKCKFVTTFNGYYSTKPSIKKCYNNVMLKGDKIIAVSNFIKDHIKNSYKCDGKKITTICRGIDATLFDATKQGTTRCLEFQQYIPDIDSKFVITSPTRLTAIKGHQTLFKALSKLPLDSKWHCFVLGSPNSQRYYKSLVKLAEELKITDHLSFIGDIDNMQAVYKASNLIVVPATKPEAFGRVPIEAQAMRRMVIATNVGGFTETIIDGKTGFLVPVNDPEALAQKIARAMAMTESQVKKMTSNARKSVCANFSLTEMQDKTIRLYESLWAKH